jgi:hypothetical protein
MYNEELFETAWMKQFYGVEKYQARKEESQRVHIMFSLRAFLRLELQRIKSGIS